jgi:hypothetical protein
MSLPSEVIGVCAPGSRHGRWRRPLRSLLLASLACLLPRPAAAGDPIADPDLVTAGMSRIGPLYFHPYLLIRDAGYDDNVRFDAKSAQGDTTITAVPGLRGLLLAGTRGGVVVSQELGYVAFQRNSELDHWNDSTRARGVLFLRRAALSLEERYDSVLERPNTEVDQRLRRLGNAVTADARTLSSGRLSLRALVRMERIDYVSTDSSAQAIARRLDRQEETLSVIGAARLLPKTSVTLESTLGLVTFDGRSLDRDSRTRSLLPGLRFDPAASIQGEFRIGVTRLEALQRRGGGYAGTVGDGHLSTRLGHFGRVKAGFSRALVFSTEPNNLFFIGSTWTTAYEQFLSPRASVEALYGHGLNHYPAPDVPSAGAGRDDRTVTYQGTFRYRMNPRVTLTLYAQRFIRNSTIDSLDRDRNFYGFGSAYDF